MGASLPLTKPCCQEVQTKELFPSFDETSHLFTCDDPLKEARCKGYSGVQSILANSSRVFYPTYLMSVCDALELDKLMNHQELLAQGKLTLYKEGMEAIFISHQWLGHSHPDNHFQQFQVLQELLKNLICGMKVLLCPALTLMYDRLEPLLTPEACNGLRDAYIWYDFFSVPQCTSNTEMPLWVHSERERAVASLPGYVSLCKHFFVLAPPIPHADQPGMCNHLSWSQRGWCRLEMAARAFALTSDNNISVYIISSPLVIVESLPFSWIQCQPRIGSFTIENDRIVVSKLMQQCVRRRTAFLQQTGETFEFRFMQAMDAHVVKGLEVEGDLKVWLNDFEFQGPLESDECGWAPIHFAALEGNLQILDALLRLGEEVDHPTTGECTKVSAESSMTPLMVAALYISDLEVAMNVALFLLHHGASLFLKSGTGKQVLHYAALGATTAPGLCSFLIDKSARIEEACDHGFTPLNWAAYTCPGGLCFAKEDKLKELVSKGANINKADGFGVLPLQHIARQGNASSIDFLLIGGAVQECAGAVGFGPVFAQVNLGEPNLVDMLKSATATGEDTALHNAAFCGNTHVVKVLLAWGADPRRKNKKGLTAADAARTGGFVALADFLEQVFSSPSLPVPPSLASSLHPSLPSLPP